MPKFSEQSLSRLSTCHRDLQRLFKTVIKHRDCTILCGYRDITAQNSLYARRKTNLMYPKSKHNQIPALAVDVMPYPIIWDDMDGIREFAGFVQGVAATMGIKIKWGGKFNGFFDGPHYELCGGDD